MSFRSCTAILTFLATRTYAMDSIATIDTMARAHGSLASIAFIVLFPTGVILLRYAHFPHLIWIHAAVQIFSYAMFISAVGLGIHLAIYWKHLSKAHPIIGLLLFSVLFFQPVTGIIHHKLFRKVKRRTATSYLHLYVGRTAIILGMINGGLGLELGQVESGYRAAYGVCCGVMGVLFLTTSILHERKRKIQQKVQATEVKEPGLEPAQSLEVQG